MSNYPLGAELDSRAPYNQIDNPDVEIEVYVWKTIGKKLKILVNDYNVVYDEENESTKYDFSDCDLWKAVDDLANVPEDWVEVDSDITIV